MTFTAGQKKSDIGQVGRVLHYKNCFADLSRPNVSFLLELKKILLQTLSLICAGNDSIGLGREINITSCSGPDSPLTLEEIGVTVKVKGVTLVYSLWKSEENQAFWEHKEQQDRKWDLEMKFEYKYLWYQSSSQSTLEVKHVCAFRTHLKYWLKISLLFYDTLLKLDLCKDWTIGAGNKCMWNSRFAM